MNKQQFAMVPIGQLRLTDNVRRSEGDIDELVESVKQLGVLQPLVCCPTEDRQHVDVLMGQRRLAAARAAGLTEVPCILRQRPAHRERVLMQLAENLDRKDMTPIDEALAFKELVEHAMTQTQIAKAVRLSQHYVSKSLQLLTMPECVKVALDIGWIPPSTAHAIPRELLRDQEAVKRLAKVLSSGTKAVDKWARDEIAGHHRTVIRSVSKVVAVTPDAYDAAVDASRRAGMSITEWVTSVVLNAAERQNRRAS